MISSYKYHLLAGSYAGKYEFYVIYRTIYLADPDGRVA
jgi:hypothetical protein